MKLATTHRIFVFFGFLVNLQRVASQSDEMESSELSNAATYIINEETGSDDAGINARVQWSKTLYLRQYAIRCILPR